MQYIHNIHSCIAYVCVCIYRIPPKLVKTMFLWETNLDLILRAPYFQPSAQLSNLLQSTSRGECMKSSLWRCILLYDQVDQMQT